MGRQSGLTLIEVLIAVLVLAIGLLGIAGLESSALTNNSIPFQYTQAATLGQSMLERMRANRQGVIDGSYTLVAGQVPPEPTIDCAGGKCPPDKQAAWDIAAWYARLHGNAYANAPTLTTIDGGTHAAVGLLPNSSASITCPTPFGTNSICTVTVFWAVNLDASRYASGNHPALYSCDPNDDDALRCFRLAFRQ